MNCPTCNGEKKLEAILCGSTGCRVDYITCSTCRGNGQITDEHYQKIKAGKLIREDRLKRGLSQREEAQRRGLTWFDYNQLENGK